MQNEALTCIPDVRFWAVPSSSNSSTQSAANGHDDCCNLQAAPLGFLPNRQWRRLSDGRQTLATQDLTLLEQLSFRAYSHNSLTKLCPQFRLAIHTGYGRKATRWQKKHFLSSKPGIFASALQSIWMTFAVESYYRVHRLAAAKLAHAATVPEIDVATRNANDSIWHPTVMASTCNLVDEQQGNN